MLGVGPLLSCQTVLFMLGPAKSVCSSFLFVDSCLHVQHFWNYAQ